MSFQIICSPKNSNLTVESLSIIAKEIKREGGMPLFVEDIYDSIIVSRALLIKKIFILTENEGLSVFENHRKKVICEITYDKALELFGDFFSADLIKECKKSNIEIVIGNYKNCKRTTVSNSISHY